ncbi:MAG: hypothetical protein M3280_11810 [Actinomycetota bacterium]|nr:hypothetical protein [Actinomycetota bacterium]
MKERFAVSFVLLTGAAAGAWAVFPTRRALTLTLLVLTLAAYGLLELNGWSKRMVLRDSRFDRMLESVPGERLVPEDLKRLERALGWMSYEPSYFDFRVRPILRELIVHRAKRDRGIDLETDYEAGIGEIKDELMNLVGKKKAETLYGTRNLTTGDLIRLIDEIEAI